MEALARGQSVAEVVQATGIPNRTIRNWRDGRTRQLAVRGAACAACGQECLPIPHGSDEAYAYLLGQYLGDGGIYEHRRKVFRLVIFGDARYVEIASEVAAAMSVVVPHVKVHHQLRGRDGTCLTTYAYSRTWPCLLPQHGAGPKHRRPIVLTKWQRAITAAHPQALLRGLIHSDGCRSINTVRASRRTYAYPRYQFSNRSLDIQQIFCEHLDLLGIPWRQMNRWNIAVSKRAGVARLDEFVGPKT
jgi:hypothetical protein